MPSGEHAIEWPADDVFNQILLGHADGGTRYHMAPIAQDGDGIGNLAHFLQTMADIEDRVSLRPEPSDGVEKDLHLVVRQRCGWFIQYQRGHRVLIVVLKGTRDGDHGLVRRPKVGHLVVGTA